MKIFWSWQSDTPGKTGRHLVRDALNEAITQLKESSEIEEPVREALHLDHDLKGLRGLRDLFPNVCKKIDEARVIVADVTPVGVAASSADKLINSNVAIELGYALRTRGVPRFANRSHELRLRLRQSS